MLKNTHVCMNTPPHFRNYHIHTFFYNICIIAFRSLGNNFWTELNFKVLLYYIPQNPHSGGIDFPGSKTEIY